MSQPSVVDQGLLVAAVQFQPERGRCERNRARLLLLLQMAIEKGAELIVLPEMCTSGYIFPDAESVRPFCEPRNGPSVKLFQREAQRSDVVICFGWPELDPVTEELFNSAAVCFPDGRVEYYRKNLLYEADETWARPGNTPYPTWTSKNGLRCTLGICMDLNDDKFIDHLLSNDIRVLAFPTNWLDQGFKVWNYWAYRLDGTSTCVVAANRYGSEDETPFCGDSAILDGRTLLGWTEEKADVVVTALIPPDPTPFPT